MKKIALTLLTLCLMSSFTVLTFAQNASTQEEVSQEGPLVNQRVLILDFNNIQQNPDIEYLSQAITNILEVALIGTDAFNIMDTEKARTYMTDNQIDLNRTFSNSVAASVGLEFGADAIIVGQYLIVDEKIRIVAKVVNPPTEQIYLALTEEGNYQDPFSTIDRMVERMAVEMKEALPPVPSRTVIRETTVVEKEGEATSTTSLQILEYKNKYKMRPLSWVFWGSAAGGLAWTTYFLVNAIDDRQYAKSCYSNYESATLSDFSITGWGSPSDWLDSANSDLTSYRVLLFGAIASTAGSAACTILGIYFWKYISKEFREAEKAAENSESEEAKTSFIETFQFQFSPTSNGGGTAAFSFRF